jgi:hypothetical protein
MTKSNFLKAGTFSALAIVFFTMNSYDTGKNASTTTGCGGCHGNTASTAVTLDVTDIPASGYIAGTSYNLVATVSHASFLKAGIDLKTSAGTITPGVGTKLNVGELVHSAPGIMVSKVASFPFIWVAPAKNTGDVTINMAGMAVDGNGQETSADQWALFSKVVKENFPANTSSLAINSLEVFPNPCTNTISIKNVSPTATVNITNLQGAKMLVNTEIINHTLQANVSNLAKGTYIFTLTNGKEMMTQKIVKQ